MKSSPPAIGTTYQSVLGAVINRTRTNSDRDITQSEIAEQLGINVSTWSRIERGESSLSLEQLVTVAAFLRVPLSALFKFVEEHIEDLRKQGVSVAVSKEALAEDRIIPLTTAQLVAVSVIPLIGPAVVAGFSVYSALLKSKKNKSV
jgi:transcriptional regulator with XRE-family HTH domain